MSLRRMERGRRRVELGCRMAAAGAALAVDQAIGDLAKLGNRFRASSAQVTPDAPLTRDDLIADLRAGKPPIEVGPKTNRRLPSVRTCCNRERRRSWSSVLQN
ncbi:MAG: hypothetical protein R2855_09975 [Thermomicrobiales bacterium]